MIKFIFNHLEIEFRLSRCYGSVAGVAHLITGHKQTQSNRVCYFHFFNVVLASKGSNQSVFIRHIP